ncbi:MAG: type II secretion system F family protein, partial [Verrucomicrobiota bacterium]
MPKFEYVAMDPKGKEVTGTLEAENQAAAHGRIREMGYFPTSIGEAGKDKRSGKSPADAKMTARTSTRKSLATRSFGGNTVKSKVLTAFTRQLATLIDAGLPILRGMDVLRKGEKDPTLRRIISKIAETVEGGSTFSEALAQHPKVFNRLFVNMVRAGEAGGVLDVTLARLADFQEKAQKIKNKVMAAMVYPSVVIFVAMSIMTFLMIVIVPKFQEIFRDLLQGAPLPVLTQFVIDVSNLIQHQALLVVGVVVGLVIGVKIFGKTKKGRYVLDNVKLHMPVFGPLLQKVG